MKFLKYLDFIPHPNRIKNIEELGDLSDDEIAELTQSVVHRIVEVMNKELDDISEKENKKIQTVAEKIVEYVREY